MLRFVLLLAFATAVASREDSNEQLCQTQYEKDGDAHAFVICQFPDKGFEDVPKDRLDLVDSKGEHERVCSVLKRGDDEETCCYQKQRDVRVAVKDTTPKQNRESRQRRARKSVRRAAIRMVCMNRAYCTVEEKGDCDGLREHCDKQSREDPFQCRKVGKLLEVCENEECVCYSPFIYVNSDKCTSGWDLAKRPSPSQPYITAYGRLSCCGEFGLKIQQCMWRQTFSRCKDARRAR